MAKKRSREMSRERVRTFKKEEAIQSEQVCPNNNLLKTLIVFDTNSLRSTEAGEVAYSFFAFGRPFQVIEDFITDNKLRDNIHLAIPKWVIEELKDQKQRQYKDDIVKLRELVKRLSGIPQISEITIPDENFDSASYIEENAKEYLGNKEVKLMEISEELAAKVLQSMMKRVLKDDTERKPFTHSGKTRDAGFKDNIIWESLINFDGVADFDKVIFITKDSDFGNCEYEFTSKWNKHFSIINDENRAIVEMTKDYELYIKERDIYEYTQTEYFKDYLFDLLNKKTTFTTDENNYNIENYNVINLCENVERLSINEDSEENIIIHSAITIFYSDSGAKKEQIVKTATILVDDTSRDIIDTTFEPELT